MCSALYDLLKNAQHSQVLNIAVYRLLAEKGVYYGSKLGKKVPALLQSLGAFTPIFTKGCTDTARTLRWAQHNITACSLLVFRDIALQVSTALQAERDLALLRR